jgi:predicted metal-dependent peptidase
MDRDAVAQIIGEAMDISRLVSAELFLAVHTEKLEWSGWVKQGDVETVKKACAHSGGTDAGPAYEAVAGAGKAFDCLVHFTDTYLPYWPEVPAKRLVVGATGLPTGAELGCKPPPGAKVLRVEV